MGTAPDDFGIVLEFCLGCSFEAITILGGPPATDPPESLTRNEMLVSKACGSLQLRDVTFAFLKTCLQFGATDSGTKDSENTLINVEFTDSTTGVLVKHVQSLVNRFVACNGGTLDYMFDIEKGGNLSVFGFSGANIKTFLRVNDAGGGVGCNKFFNIRLDTIDWQSTNRTKIFEGVEDGDSNNVFFGLMIGGGPEDENGAARFTMRHGHWVELHNASYVSSSHPLATPGEPLVEFVGPSTRRAIFRCFTSDIPPDSRVRIAPTTNPPIPSFARYAFISCNDGLEPTPDAYHTPLYAPNHLMVCESHCWAIGNGLDGVNAYATGIGNAVIAAPVSDEFRAGVIACNTIATGVVTLLTGPAAMRHTGGPWRFQGAVRVPNLSTSSNRFVVRMGYGDRTDAEPDNGVFFRYSDNIHSGKWQAVVRVSGAAETAVDTTIAADTGWHCFEIDTDAEGGSSFYIDGVRRAINAAFPDVPMGLMPLQLSRLAAPAEGEFSAEIDYYRYGFRPTSTVTMFPEQ